MKLYLVIYEPIYQARYAVVRAESKEVARKMAGVDYGPVNVQELNPEGPAELLWDVCHDFEPGGGEA